MPTTTTLAVVDGVPFTDAATAALARVKLTGPADVLDFGERVAYEFIPSRGRVSVAHAVTVAAAAAASDVRGGGDGATVGEMVAINLSSARSVTDVLTVGDFVSYYLATYAWVNPIVTVPANAGNLTLESAFGGTVVLRKPDFGDADAYEAFRVSRQSRGGDLQIYQDPMWPKTESLSFKFSYLDPIPAQQLLTFLKASAGARVTLTDHYGRVWSGWITTPAGEVVRDKRSCATAAFKFQVAPS